MTERTSYRARNRRVRAELRQTMRDTHSGPFDRLVGWAVYALVSVAAPFILAYATATRPLRRDPYRNEDPAWRAYLDGETPPDRPQ